jgi:hypothetical protein
VRAHGPRPKGWFQAEGLSTTKVVLVRTSPGQSIEQSDDGYDWTPCELETDGRFRVTQRLYRLALLNVLRS